MRIDEDNLGLSSPSPSEIVLEEPKIDLSIESEAARGVAASLFDLDGTLVEGFTLGRFVSFLDRHNIGDSDSRKQLLGLFADYQRQWRNYRADTAGSNEPNYESFIRESSKVYAHMLRGYNVQQMHRIGTAWSIKDVKEPQRIFSFSRDLIALLKSIGVIPTLLTGSPSEVIEGYRRELGIEAVAHTMELETEKRGSASDDGALYTGEVLRNTGLLAKKADLCAQISERHPILFGAGDRLSDGPLINSALTAIDRKDVYGSALIVNPDPATEVALRATFQAYVNDRRLIKIEEGQLPHARVVVSIARTALRDALNDSRNKEIPHVQNILQKLTTISE